MENKKFMEDEALQLNRWMADTLWPRSWSYGTRSWLNVILCWVLGIAVIAVPIFLYTHTH
jgi:hypothetical protein